MGLARLTRLPERCYLDAAVGNLVGTRVPRGSVATCCHKHPNFLSAESHANPQSFESLTKVHFMNPISLLKDWDSLTHAKRKDKREGETGKEHRRAPFLVTHFRGRDRSVTLDVRKTPNLNGLACMDLSCAAFNGKKSLYLDEVFGCDS